MVAFLSKASSLAFAIASSLVLASSKTVSPLSVLKRVYGFPLFGSLDYNVVHSNLLSSLSFQAFG
jgi:hypothetical protein